MSDGLHRTLDGRIVMVRNTDMGVFITYPGGHTECVSRVR